MKKKESYKYHLIGSLVGAAIGYGLGYLFNSEYSIGIMSVLGFTVGGLIGLLIDKA